MNLAQQQLLKTLKRNGCAYPWSINTLLRLEGVTTGSNANDDWDVFEQMYGKGKTDPNHNYIEQPREWWLERAAEVLSKDEILEVLLQLETP